MAGKKAKERAVMDGFADVKIILIYYKNFFLLPFSLIYG